jgi:hypothetical protein
MGRLLKRARADKPTAESYYARAVGWRCIDNEENRPVGCGVQFARHASVSWRRETVVATARGFFWHGGIRLSLAGLPLTDKHCICAGSMSARPAFFSWQASNSYDITTQLGTMQMQVDDGTCRHEHGRRDDERS